MAPPGAKHDGPRTEIGDQILLLKRNHLATFIALRPCIISSFANEATYCAIMWAFSKILLFLSFHKFHTMAVFRSIEKCTMQKKIPCHIKLAIHVWSAKCG
jgi:hypothetical protein